MQEHFEQFDNAEFSIIAITKDAVKENKTRKNNHKLDYPILFDRKLKVAKKFDVEIWEIQREERVNPGVVVIDSDNLVTFTQEVEELITHWDGGVDADGKSASRSSCEQRPPVGEI